MSRERLQPCRVHFCEEEGEHYGYCNAHWHELTRPERRRIQKAEKKMLEQWLGLQKTGGTRR